MPELPEVETVVNDLRPLIKNKTIIDVKIFHEKSLKNVSKKNFMIIIGQKILNVSRKAKYIIFELENNFLISHLRMEGKWNLLKKNDLIENKNHIILQISLNSKEELIFYDFRKFATIDLITKNDLEVFFKNKKIGPEPWDLIEDNFIKLVWKSKRPIKSFLLDQKNLSGIGNIYADEILYKSKIHPLTYGENLPKEKIIEIIENTNFILKKSIELGGTSIRTYSSINDKKGSYQSELKVHTKEGEKCFDNNHKVVKIKVNGRGTYYCEGVQKKWN